MKVTVLVSVVLVMSFKINMKFSVLSVLFCLYSSSLAGKDKTKLTLQVSHFHS